MQGRMGEGEAWVPDLAVGGWFVGPGTVLVWGMKVSLGLDILVEKAVLQACRCPLFDDPSLFQ